MDDKKIIARYRLVNTVKSYEDFTFHSHEKYEIYYFHGGTCKYLISDHIYDLQKDDIIIMNGLTLHRAYPEPGIPYERSLIEFSSEWLRPILYNLNVPELLNPFNQLSNTLFRGVDSEILMEIKELIRRIVLIDVNNFYEDENSVESRLREGEISNLVVQLLFKIYEISQQQLVKIAPIESEKNTHVKRMISWMEKNFCNPTSLNCIADSLNLSKYYMSRIFKDVTGLTIMQYLMTCRLNRAKYLLEIHPEKSILEVALQSGFEDASHFSRFFRKQMKITPSDYRNRRAPRTQKTIKK
ncbi:AraC family transcriptional regulator [Neobacillus cucumis]|uniref:AraC family transcriptional regulator n=1 Tax=Neobacillus cucumis TaxID=1740721 RepID=UPI0021558CE8|nr:AraC family transcriptional regulator [Neobacillus cucumis]